MNPNPQTLLPAGVSLWLLLPVALLLLVVWVRSHSRSRGLARRWRPVAAAARTLLGALTLVAFGQAAGQVFTLATDWNLWVLLTVGAAAVEGVLALYRLEREMVPRRHGIALALLRVALVLAVLAMLCQPVLVLNSVRDFRRQVVVLLDESNSMRVPDNNLTPGEKVRLAEGLAFQVPARTFRLEQVAAGLQVAREAVQAQADWISALGSRDPELSSRQLFKNRAAFQEALGRALAAVEAGTNVLATAAASPAMMPNAATKAALEALVGKLATNVRPPLTNLIDRTTAWRRASTNGVAQSQAALADLQAVVAVLGDLTAPIRDAGDKLDGVVYAAYAPADRAQVDRLADMPRLDIARALLQGAPPAPTNGPPDAAEPEGLLARLDRTYGVRLYTVGAAPVETTLESLRAAAPPATDDDQAQRRRSDLAGALEKVAASLTPEQTAGILLLTDGRHNAAAPVEAVARSLGLGPVPVYPVVFGGNRAPPTDAAIVAVGAPDTVSTNDRIQFSIEVKADGLTGTNLTVLLYDDDRLVATNSFKPDGATFRTHLSLSDHPMTNALHNYRVELAPQPGEVDTNNNVRLVPVLVNSDPVNVLLIDGLPRWEFRYVKNLFMELDQNVRLQYLLFHPDRIAGTADQPVIAASVSRPADEIEATALPASEAEWMKFDVILLGDVSPAELGAANQQILSRYVLNRGGTLVVTAGARHMPHAFGRTPIEALLPVSAVRASQPVLAAPEPAFRIALTALGRGTAYMRMDDDGLKNQAAWNDVPELYWRHGRVTAKANASVLAYAIPADEAQRAGQAGFVPGADALAQQQARERERVLIATHQAGFGQVLFLATDQMWRLRYREGDTRYHKFWGQVLRWATADRIAAGSATLRLGPDRPRYATDEPVRIRARVATPDLTPVVDADLRVTVWSGSRRVVRRALVYVEESPGVYSAEIGVLPEGRYRVTCDPKDARGLPAALTEPVFADFAVTDAIASESVELTADRGLLERVAALSTGAALDPLELATIAERLGPAEVRRAERRQLDLWNSWPWLILIAGLFTAEWLLRKKARLP